MGRSIYDELSAMIQKDTADKLQQASRDIGKSRVLGAAYGAGPKSLADVFPEPDPNRFALKVKCPVCKAGAGVRCTPTTHIRPPHYTKAMRRIAGELRKHSHPARLSRAALKFPEELT